MDAKYYDDFYRLHGASVHDDPSRFVAVAQLVQGHVLDIGCGTGTLADFYAGEYTGVDYSKVAIDHARTIRRASANFIVSSAEDLKTWGAKKYNSVVMAEFLEHIDADDGILDVLANMTAENGRWIISVPNGDRVPDPSHVRMFTVPELRKKFSKYGYVKFHNWVGFQQRILMSVEVGQTAQLRLGLPMVVKNEAKGLEFAILSAIEIVDHIQIAVDDSSTDETLAVAQRYADVVRPYKWGGSFSAARNLAQSDLPTKWALILDGHEFVKDLKSLDDVLELNVDGIVVVVELENGFENWFPRIIKSNINWLRDVHNFPDCKSTKVSTAFRVKHDRTNFQSIESIRIRNAQREKMIFGILGDAVKKNKKDVRSLFYLAQQSMLNKDFRRAIKYHKQYLKYATNPQERWLVRYDMAMARVQLGHLFRAIWALHNAEDELPNRWETSELMGAIYAMRGKYFMALRYLVDSMKQSTGRFVYNPIKHDYVKTWDLIGRCLFNMKKYEEARIAFKRAIAVGTAMPESEQDKEKLAQIAEFVKLQE